MSSIVARRTFLAGAASLGFLAPRGLAFAADGPTDAVPGSFPRQQDDVVREVVRFSHFNFDAVKKIVEARPALARASWDWGFGDWESALGAASHMGRRDIAEVLLAHGARPNLFSAAMLGQLDVVRAFVAASPGVQRTPGPHGLTLMTHARNGGVEAQAVVEYLEGLGDADVGPARIELTDAQRGRYVGDYAFGDGESARLRVFEKDGSLRVQRGEEPARFLTPVGDHAFYPSGAEAVRLRFTMESGRAVMLDVHDPDLILRAHRVG